MTNQAFTKRVWGFFRQHGRSLPWRHNTDPYKILVSEIMLQQTQVDRVIPKYRAWLQRFPTAKTLAGASLAEVLTMWQGLGYNRRAIALKRAAERLVIAKKFPREREKILELPGVGPYTAGAVAAFAFNEPVVMIETNIRTVFIHHFFADKKKVSDAELLPLIEATLDRRKPREWYWALMDYGSYLKKKVGNASQRSAHHTRQSPFAGSNRQLRGAVLKYVTSKPLAVSVLQKKLVAAGLAPSREHLTKTLGTLTKEGFITQSGTRVALAQ
jgi:A/G-specific adenine glycosylase